MNHLTIECSRDREGITFVVHSKSRHLLLPSSASNRIFIAFDRPSPDHEHLMLFMASRWKAVAMLLTGWPPGNVTIDFVDAVAQTPLYTLQL